MAQNLKISEMSNGGSVQSTDQIPLVRGGQNYYGNVVPNVFVVSVDTSITGTGNDTNLTLLKSSIVPSNTLKNDGDYLKVRAFVGCEANTNAKTIRLNFQNGNSIYVSTTSSDYAEMEAIIIRQSNTHYQYSGRVIAIGESEPLVIGSNIPLSSGTFTTSTFEIDLYGQNSVANVNDIQSYYFIIEAYTS